MQLAVSAPAPFLLHAESPSCQESSVSYVTPEPTPPKGGGGGWSSVVVADDEDRAAASEPEDEEDEVEQLTALWTQLKLENAGLKEQCYEGTLGIAQMGSLNEALSTSVAGLDRPPEPASSDEPGDGAAVPAPPLPIGKRSRTSTTGDAVAELVRPRKQLSDGSTGNVSPPHGPPSTRELLDLIARERASRQRYYDQIRANAERLEQLQQQNDELRRQLTTLREQAGRAAGRGKTRSPPRSGSRSQSRSQSRSPVPVLPEVPSVV